MLLSEACYTNCLVLILVFCAAWDLVISAQLFLYWWFYSNCCLRPSKSLHACDLQRSCFFVGDCIYAVAWSIRFNSVLLCTSVYSRSTSSCATDVCIPLLWFCTVDEFHYSFGYASLYVLLGPVQRMCLSLCIGSVQRIRFSHCFVLGNAFTFFLLVRLESVQRMFVSLFPGPAQWMSYPVIGLGVCCPLHASFLWDFLMYVSFRVSASLCFLSTTDECIPFFV